MLRCLEQEGESFSVQKISQKLGHTDLDVKRAFDYWEQQGMLRQERDAFGELTGICVLDPLTQGFGGTAPEEVSRDEDDNDNDEALADILFLAETYSGHPLSPKDIDRILFWYDTLGMPADMVEYLITYCADKGHCNIAYMDKIAISWSKNGILTMEDAKADTARHSEVYYTVCSGFGITGRNLAPAELDYIHRWEAMFKDADIIREACSRTILRTGKSSFGYADRILTDWHKQGIKTLSDIEDYDRTFAERRKLGRTPVGHKRPTAGGTGAFHNFTERDYEDWDDIEAKLLARSKK